MFLFKIQVCLIWSGWCLPNADAAAGDMSIGNLAASPSLFHQHSLNGQSPAKARWGHCSFPVWCVMIGWITWLRPHLSPWENLNHRGGYPRGRTQGLQKKKARCENDWFQSICFRLLKTKLKENKKTMCVTRWRFVWLHVNYPENFLNVVVGCTEFTWRICFYQF